VTDPLVLAERFNCAVTIGGSVSHVAFPAAWAAMPSPYHDPDLWQEGVARCEADMRLATDAPLVSRVRAHVGRALDERRMASLAETARALGTSSRSLVRALAVGGITHHQIVDRERQARARRLLAQPLVPIVDIVEALGFADQSSFGRKCRAWFGESPARFRRQHCGAVPPAG
jgi:AraC-like DNA-binding protein